MMQARGECVARGAFLRQHMKLQALPTSSATVIIHYMFVNGELTKSIPISVMLCFIETNEKCLIFVIASMNLDSLTA